MHPERLALTGAVSIDDRDAAAVRRARKIADYTIGGVFWAAFFLMIWFVMVIA